MADAASSRIESGVIDVLKNVSRRPIEPTLSSDQFGLPLGNVVLVPGGTIGRTTSGKVRRTALRDSYFRGELGAAGVSVRSADI